MRPQSNRFWEFLASAQNSGELLLYGPISESSWWGDEVTPKQFAEDLKALGNISELTVRINSGGGDVFAAQAIYSQLKTHQANVTVYIDGLAASAATIIAMAGDKIVMPTNAMMMIHNPMTLMYGNANEFRKIADVLDQVRDTIVSVYQDKTGMSKDQLIELMDAETWMTADLALSSNFVDQIDHESPVQASISNNVLFMNGKSFDLKNFKNTQRVVASLGTGSPTPPNELSWLNLTPYEERIANLISQSGNRIRNKKNGVSQTEDKPLTEEELVAQHIANAMNQRRR